MTGLDGRGLRLAELVAVLSLGTDLGLGQPMQHALWRCLLALRLASRLELDDDERAVLNYNMGSSPLRGRRTSDPDPWSAPQCCQAVA